MRAVGARLAAWLAARSARERALVGAAAALTVLVAGVLAALAVRDDLASLSARVAGHERELREVRRLAAALLHDPATGAPEAADATALMARLEAAVDGAVGRERIAGMTPAPPRVEGGLVEERVTLRVSGASLGDTVRLLYALEGASPPLRVTRLELRKHPDDPARFEATLEAAALRAGP